MTKEEFEKKIKDENPYIGVNKIRLNKFVPASFILGCYYNEQEKKWHIYETDERGLEESIFEANNEEEAYDRLYDLIMIHKRLSERIKNNT